LGTTGGRLSLPSESTTRTYTLGQLRMVSARAEGLPGKATDASPPCSSTGAARTHRHDADHARYKLQARPGPAARSPSCDHSDRHGGLSSHLGGFLRQGHLGDLWLQPIHRITQCCVMVRINLQEPIYLKTDFSGGTYSRGDLTRWPPQLLLILGYVGSPSLGYGKPKMFGINYILFKLQLCLQK